MEQIAFKSRKAWEYIRKNWFIFFAVAVYFIFTAYYMGPSVTNCTDTVYGFGDNTAGPIWRATLPQEQGLIGSWTDVTNYPYGDNLASPVAYSLILQTVLIKGAQAIAGPVCGYNLVNIIGFMASALMMFGFIYWLTRNRWVALFAGYAVAFTPYYQMKVGGHPSYGFQALFIAIIWLFYRLLKYRRTKDAVYLGLAFGVSVYFDPYFSLFSSLILLGLGLGWLILSRQLFSKRFWKHDKVSVLKQQLKKLLLAVGVMIMTILPLAGVLLTQGKEINDSVAASRGNVIMEAKLCSNWPHEYLVPFVLHPVFQKIFGPGYRTTVDNLRGGHSCGIGEDTIGLSLVLVGIVLVGLLVLTWDKLRGRRIGLWKTVIVNPRLLVLTILLVGFLAFIFAFPPGKLQGIIPTPSYELLQLTQTWRTLTRFYMIVNIALVTMAAILLVYYREIFKRYKVVIALLFAAMWAGVFIEYQAFSPMSGNTMSTFSYSKNIPSVYEWIKSQKDVAIVAEYPLEQYGKESDAMSYFLSMQTAHGKKLFNSALSYGPQERYKDGLKNLSDPQTLRTLKAYGVDIVIVHGVSEALLRDIPGAEIVYSAPQAQFNINSHSPVVNEDNVVVLSLKNVIGAAYYIDPGEGFARNATIIHSVVDWKYEAISGSKIGILRFNNQHKVYENKDEVKVCFSAQMSVADEVTTLHAKAGNMIIDLGLIDGSIRNYVLSTNQDIEIVTDNGHNMRLSKLGCSEL